MRNLAYLGMSVALGLCVGVTNCATSDGNPLLGSKGGTTGSTTSPGGTSVPGSGGGTSIIIGAGGQTGGVFASTEPTCTQCTDFPSTPIVEAGAEKGPTSFGGSASGTGPCIIEPEPGTLFPRNWLRPRLNVQGGTKTGLFQITIHADREVNDLVVYTTKLPWALPKDLWVKLATNVMEEDVTVTLRQSQGSSFSESKTNFRIAPVEAGGSIVFWHATATDPGTDTSALFGFAPGDEGVASVLLPGQVKTPMYGSSGAPKNTPGVPAAGVGCVGCHTSTPDGSAVTFDDFYPWNVAIASVNPGETGNIPTYVSQAGRMMAQSPWQGVTTFSVADWATGKRRYVTSFVKRTMSTSPSDSWSFWPGQDSYATASNDDLIWVDLAGAGTVDVTNGSSIGASLVGLRGTLWDIMLRSGDPRAAVTPDWSHDGLTIAYTSTDSTSDGRVGKGPKGPKAPTAVDVYVVPFDGGKGGAATPLKGASDPTAFEYYPDFSADDRYVAFNRLATAVDDVYYRKEAELYIVPAAGGDAIRLAANDPAQCAGLAGNTVRNSWAKWSPSVRDAKGNKYYFLTFSSARYSTMYIKAQRQPNNDITTVQPNPYSTADNVIPVSELFLTTIKVDASGKVTTYPAVYLWNQNSLVTTDASGKAVATPAYGLNVTPAWDEFVIPPVPPIVLL